MIGPEPAFEIPLIRSELEALGRCAVIFGQIDHMLTDIIAHLVYIDTLAAATELDEVTTGRKLSILRRHWYRVTNPEALGILKKFDEHMGGLVARRNHMFHGMWGWHIAGAKSKPGCVHFKYREKPLYPEAIAKYARYLTEQSHALRRAYALILGLPLPNPDDPTNRFHFTDGETFASLPARGIQTEEVGRTYKGRPDPQKTPTKAKPPAQSSQD